METNKSMALSNFKEAAIKVFLNLWFDFEKHARKLDRDTDDNVFQQLQGRYIIGLKTELLKNAEICLGGYCGDRNSLRRNLNDQVAQNVSAFILRARQL